MATDSTHSHNAATVTADQSRPIQQKTKKFRSFLNKINWKRRATMTADTSINAPAQHNNKVQFLRPVRRRQMVTPQTTKLSNHPVMSFLQNDCPVELLPRILAFAGPRTTSTLSRTCHFWKSVVDLESTWMIMSQEMHKWKEGDEVPDSWRDFYKYNPCVPVDYSNVNSALSIVQGSQIKQSRSIRVLLRPGRYLMRDAITVQAARGVLVEIAMMDVPDSYEPVDEIQMPGVAEDVSRKRKVKSFRNILTCQTIDVEEPEDDVMRIEAFDPSMVDKKSEQIREGNTKVATLVMCTRRQNQPIIHVQQGNACLRNLKLDHSSHGLDIWNGNAAVQIQPPTNIDNQPILVSPPPRLDMHHVEVRSTSGRGIVNIDGGKVSVQNCYVHDCAATGIYVGGPGSRAIIEQTDVIRNGNGNVIHRRGISRGHSGVYLEQGHASIVDCNISLNSLTGISAISQDNAFLELRESELVSNGSFQLEMPGLGTNSFSRSTTRNNTMAAVGLPRTRSGLAFE